MAFWTKSRLIFNAFRDNARASIRQVARQTGLSKSSVHRLGQAMARRNQHREAWEREGIAQGQIGPIVGSVDDTFLERMIWVFMDLMSGYVLLEETADERTYETWYERVRARLEPLKTSVLYLVSDRAKALIKL